MTNSLLDCEACTKGIGSHKYNTKQHGVMPQSWIEADKNKRPKSSEEITEKIKSLREKYRGRWVKISPYSKLGSQVKGLPLFNYKEGKKDVKKRTNEGTNNK